MKKAVVKYLTREGAVQTGLILEDTSALTQFEKNLKRLVSEIFVLNSKLYLAGIERLINDGKVVFINERGGYCSVDNTLEIISTQDFSLKQP